MRYKKNSIIEPDYSRELEEIAEIPEKVSEGTPVDEGVHNAPIGKEELPGAGAPMEELLVPPGSFSESMIVEDDYRATAAGIQRGNFAAPKIWRELPGITDSAADESVLAGEELDIGSVASEIDSMVKREAGTVPPTKVAVEEESLLHKYHLEAMEAPREQNGDIIIEEDDDIDLDYYSLEELKRKATDPLESFELSQQEIPEPDFTVSVTPASGKKPKGKKKDGKAESHEDRKAPPKDNTIVIEVPEELRKKLPGDFDIKDLGIIDLLEAEQIANENILLFSEDEIIEELEEFDLLPVKEHAAAEETKDHSMDGRGSPAGTGIEEDEEENRADDEDDRIHEEAADEVKEKVVPVEDGVADKTPGEEIPEAAFGENEPEAAEILMEEVILTGEGEAVPIVRETAPDEGEVTPVVLYEEIHQDVRMVDESPQGRKEDEATEAADSYEVSKVSGVPPVLTDAIDDSIDVEMKYSSAADLPGPPRVIGDFPTVSGRQTSLEDLVQPQTGNDGNMAVFETKSDLVKEVIPIQMLKSEQTGDTVKFIDDELVESPADSDQTSITVDELERISSEIIQSVEGDAILLAEGEPSGDFTRVAGIMRGTTPAFEDLLQDFKEEQTHGDEDVSMVNSVFEAEDYAHYIDDLDRKPELPGGKRSSVSIEILGINKRELNELENSIFQREYDKVNIEEELGGMRPGMDQPEFDVNLLKRCKYISSQQNALSLDERKSIEEDMIAETGLVIEEDIEEVKNRLEQLRMHKGLPNEKISFNDANNGKDIITDISDKVFIIDDKTDRERFINSIPVEKRENLTRLLKYLDGMFEKLPEEVIRKFATSEYFDLYNKVLNDLGV